MPEKLVMTSAYESPPVQRGREFQACTWPFVFDPILTIFGITNGVITRDDLVSQGHKFGAHSFRIVLRSQKINCPGRPAGRHAGVGFLIYTQKARMSRIYYLQNRSNLYEACLSKSLGKSGGGRASMFKSRST